MGWLWSARLPCMNSSSQPFPGGKPSYQDISLFSGNESSAPGKKWSHKHPWKVMPGGNMCRPTLANGKFDFNLFRFHVWEKWDDWKMDFWMSEEEKSQDNWDLTSQLSGRDVMSYVVSITPYPAMRGSTALLLPKPHWNWLQTSGIFT